jgi:hypothetical protein
VRCVLYVMRCALCVVRRASGAMRGELRFWRLASGLEDGFAAAQRGHAPRITHNAQRITLDARCFP